ncbi:hypothetical protein JB92DRAFT_2878391, partial [Gautieria morchelliformis]
MSHTPHSIQTAPEELPVLAEMPVAGGMDPAHNNNALTLNGDPPFPINRLPVEILSTIFSLNIPRGKHSRKNMSSILPMTWVCGHWRSVAVNFAQFWTLIDLSRSQEFIEEALKRSKKANLTIVQSRDVSEDLEACRVFDMFWRIMDPLKIDPLTGRPGPLMNRVVALELHLTRRQWKHILPIIQQATPSLRHLILSASDIHNPKLKFHYLSLDKEQLRMVTHDISTCLPWDCLPRLTHGLRELKLSVYKSADTLRPLFDFLEACSELEHLDLQMKDTYFHSMQQATHTEGVDVPPTLTMPRLVKLTLHNTLTTHITDRLVTPRLRQCSVTLDSSQWPPPKLGDFLAKNLDISKARKLSIVAESTNATNELCFWAPSTSSRPTSRSGSYAGPDSGLLDELLDPVLQLTFKYSISYDTYIKPLYESLIGKASDLKKLVLRGDQPPPRVLNSQWYR